MERRFAIVPGDGIGIDVTKEAVRVLEAASKAFGFTLTLTSFPYGADHYLKTGETLPPGTHETWARDFDAIFMGAFGDPRVPDMRHAAEILLGTRFAMDLYANVRPVRCLAERLCPLRAYHAEDVDFVVFRENTEGLYAGVGGIFKKGTPDEIGIQENAAQLDILAGLDEEIDVGSHHVMRVTGPNHVFNRLDRFARGEIVEWDAEDRD